jgi:hypothetical protein
MADFNPITTQEEFDAAIGERLKRERETIAKKYGDYEDLKSKVGTYEKQLADLTATAQADAKKAAGHERTIADLQAQLKGHETASVKTRIAHETGIPYEMASRLTGETEDEIRADAQSLSRLMRQSEPIAPAASTEPGSVDPKEAGMRDMLRNLKI